MASSYTFYFNYISVTFYTILPYREQSQSQLKLRESTKRYEKEKEEVRQSHSNTLAVSDVTDNLILLYEKQFIKLL